MPPLRRFTSECTEFRGGAVRGDDASLGVDSAPACEQNLRAVAVAKLVRHFVGRQLPPFSWMTMSRCSPRTIAVTLLGRRLYGTP